MCHTCYNPALNFLLFNHLGTWGGLSPSEGLGMQACSIRGEQPFLYKRAIQEKSTNKNHLCPLINQKRALWNLMTERWVGRQGMLERKGALLFLVIENLISRCLETVFQLFILKLDVGMPV